MTIEQPTTTTTTEEVPTGGIEKRTASQADLDNDEEPELEKKVHM